MYLYGVRCIVLCFSLEKLETHFFFPEKRQITPTSSCVCHTLQVSNGYVPQPLRLREAVHIVLPAYVEVATAKRGTWHLVLTVNTAQIQSIKCKRTDHVVNKTS